MKIAIIGGSFDPIHFGHTAMARYVLKHRLAEAVWFMVTAKTPLKDRSLTDNELRNDMVKAAIAYDKRFKICLMEQQRDGISYTLDTVRELKKRYPQHSFVWLIGNDQAMQLSKWRGIDELSKLIEFYVFPRHNETISCAYPHQLMKMELIDVSSSEIRSGQRLWLVSKGVKALMAKHYLYLDSFAAARMSERRFAHSKSVAKLCVTLAQCHGVDVLQAYCAGILHDVCKEWDKQRLNCYLQQLDPRTLQEHPTVWHGYAAAYYVSKSLGIHQRGIRAAIYHHVKGSDQSKLCMIVYVSDKLDPSRGYDSSETIALCKKDLAAGYRLALKQQAEYLMKEKQNKHESRTESGN